MDEAALYYTALAVASRTAALHVVVVTACAAPCKMRSFPSRTLVAARLPCAPDHARPPRPGSPRQGARHLRLRRPPPHRRDRSDLGVRLRARLGHPGQGHGAHADLARSGSSTSRHVVPNHVLSTDPADYPDDGPAARRPARGAARCSCAGPSRCRSSAWRAATCRGPAGRTTRRRARSAASRLPAGLTRVGAAAGAHLHAGDQGAERPRHQHHARPRRPTLVGPAVLDARPRPDARVCTGRARRTPNRSASSSPTRSSSSASCRPTAARPPTASSSSTRS